MFALSNKLIRISKQIRHLTIYRQILLGGLVHSKIIFIRAEKESHNEKKIHFL